MPRRRKEKRGAVAGSAAPDARGVGSSDAGAGAGAGASAGAGAAGPGRVYEVTARPCLPPSWAGKGKGKQAARASVRMQKAQLYRGDMIFDLQGFLSPDECQAWIRFAEAKGFTDVFHEETSEIAHRDNGRLQCDDPQALLWERLKPVVPGEFLGLRAVGCNPNIRMYRYGPGQRFGRHVDESVDGADGSVSVFTVLVYLNGDTAEQPLKGGCTTFYGDSRGREVALAVAPEAGKALLHGHGHRCLLHEGSAVEEGTKYLLRTDVMYSADADAEERGGKQRRGAHGRSRTGGGGGGAKQRKAKRSRK